MTLRRLLLCLAAAASVAGCDLSRYSPAPDLSMGPPASFDLATVDRAASPDLGAPPDLATGPDGGTTADGASDAGAARSDGAPAD